MAIATWNSRGLFGALAGNSLRISSKFKQLERLALMADIIVLQECHGRRADLVALERAFRGWVIQGSFLPSAAGGIVALVRRSFLVEHFDNVTWDFVHMGRCMKLEMEGPSGRLVVFGIHAPNACDGVGATPRSCARCWRAFDDWRGAGEASHGVQHLEFG